MITRRLLLLAASRPRGPAPPGTTFPRPLSTQGGGDARDRRSSGIGGRRAPSPGAAQQANEAEAEDDQEGWIRPPRPLLGGGDAGAGARVGAGVQVGAGGATSSRHPSGGGGSDRTGEEEEGEGEAAAAMTSIDLDGIDLRSVDWDTIEVEGLGPGGVGPSRGRAVPANYSGGDDGLDEDFDADEVVGVDFDAIERAGGSVLDVGAYVAKMMAESGGDDDGNNTEEDEDEEDEEMERLELELLEEEILRLEREEEEERGGRTEGSKEGARAWAGGILSDDPTNLTVDDFIFERAEEERRRRLGQRKVGAETAAETTSKGGGEGADGGSADGPDWLASRRARLSSARPVGMLTPSDADAARELGSELPVIRHTLLTAREITACVSSLGAADVRVVEPERGSDGTTGLGCDGLVVATGRDGSHLRVLADAVARNLRARDLGRRGVVGARLGPEGGEDGITSRRNRRRAGGTAGGKMDDDWMVVDCGNYVLHLQTEPTRRHVDLVGLWSSDAAEGRPGRELRSLDWCDEDAVDDYVAANPIPDEYARIALMQNAADVVVPQFTRKGRGERWNPIKKVKKKRGGRRRF